MDESVIKGRIRKTIILVACIGVVLLITTILIASWLNSAMTESTNEQMEAEVEDYISRIKKQIDSDLQSMNTLSVFIETSEIDTDNDSRFAEVLHASNQQNDFITMGFFDTDGTGVMSTLGYEPVSGIETDSLKIEVKEIISMAFDGAQSVSNLFRSDVNDEKIFIYGVPVYRNGGIIGVLVASKQVEIFVDILNGETVLNGSGYIHMINNEGRFLIRSKKTAIKEKMDTIFDGNYLSDREDDRIINSLRNQESVCFTLKYKGGTYQCFIKSVGINDWNLFYVNTIAESNKAAYQIINIMSITFVCIIAIVVFLLFYSYRAVRKNNNELIYLAYHDTLTGAYNLPRFIQKLGKRLEQSGGCSVVALNVHQFKFINEIFGREQADKLLCYIKSVLDKYLDEKEFCCRDAADLFYICIDSTEKPLIREKMQKIMDEISGSSTRAQSSYRITMYCGVAISDDGKHEVSKAGDIMTHVMFALTTAKNSYNDKIWFYDSNLHEIEKKENYIESHMHKALAQGEFKLFLQPKINLKDDSLGGAEALVRWITDEGEILYPDQFIPMFEKNGFCIDLDTYMIECACKQIRKWIDDGITPIEISVNQSKLLFYENNYIQNLSDLIDKYNIPAELITLEILEGLAADNLSELNKIIERLHNKGFKVSMDDFGSGYSSLNTLGKLNIDELKLDRGFLKEVSNEENARQKIIMEQIVQLTKRLEISTVIEGVETEKDEKLSKDICCDFGQGFYYSRPISVFDFNKKYMEPSSKD